MMSTFPAARNVEKFALAVSRMLPAADSLTGVPEKVSADEVFGVAVLHGVPLVAAAAWMDVAVEPAVVPIATVAALDVGGVITLMTAPMSTELMGNVTFLVGVMVVATGA